VLARFLDTRNKRIVAAIVGVALLGSAVAFAALGDDEEAAPATTTTTTTAPTTTTEPEPVAPLTGLPGSYQDRLSRPALVVKIDNVQPKARPQVGINQADVVFEERVEGSVTRLLAVFHSTDSVPVGPVRSARTTDILIFSALGRPFFAWSGANPTFAGRVRAANVQDVGYDAVPGEYFREPTRAAPSNLMLRSTATVQAMPNAEGKPPRALFKYRKSGQKVNRNLQPANGAAVSFGSSAGAAPTEWRWVNGGWARFQAGTPHVDVAGEQVHPANVVIQFVDYVPSDTADQFGVPIPEAKLVGEGDVWILTGTKGNHGVVKGRWRKEHPTHLTRYTDADGKPILLQPGRTWVVLPTPGGARLL